MKKKLTFAFDMGLASLGIAVKEGDDIIHAESLLIDEDIAKISHQAKRLVVLSVVLLN